MKICVHSLRRKQIIVDVKQFGFTKHGLTTGVMSVTESIHQLMMLCIGWTFFFSLFVKAVHITFDHEKMFVRTLQHKFIKTLEMAIE